MKNYELMERLSKLPAGATVKISALVLEDEIEDLDEDVKKIEKELEEVDSSDDQIWIN